MLLAGSGVSLAQAAKSIFFLSTLRTPGAGSSADVPGIPLIIFPDKVNPSFDALCLALQERDQDLQNALSISAAFPSHDEPVDLWRELTLRVAA
jgi:hypothetical protein